MTTSAIALQGGQKRPHSPFNILGQIRHQYHFEFSSLAEVQLFVTFTVKQVNLTETLFRKLEIIAVLGALYFTKIENLSLLSM